MPDYNYAAAFLAFSRGTAPDDIALALAIPLTTLRNKIRTEAWKRLAGELTTPASVPEVRGVRDLNRIAENRERNYAIALKLQEDLAEVVTKLREGTLRFKRMTAKGECIELPPTLHDRRDLATYAREVAELSYRALGDVLATREGGDAVPGVGQITIILPGPVLTPREERSVNVNAEVITLDSKAVEVGPATPAAGQAAALTDVSSSQPEP